jgi:peptidoglycan-N-acetylglucosamine deacetylase
MMHQTWKPSLAIKASVVLHVGAGAGLFAGLPWPWAVGGVVANHALLTAAGLWPRSTLLGHNIRNLSLAACNAGQLAITIDDGPDPAVTPAVLDILDAAGARATFFCIGKAVRTHPGLAREIVERGHAIENHSHDHQKYFSFLGPGGLRTDITNAQLVIKDTTGQVPLFFRAPAGLRSPLLDSVLQKLDLQLVSWTRRGFDTVTRDAEKVRSRLEERLQAGDILLLHDGNAASTPTGAPVVLKVLPQLLKTIKERGLQTVLLRNTASY